MKKAHPGFAQEPLMQRMRINLDGLAPELDYSTSTLMFDAEVFQPSGALLSDEILANLKEAGLNEWDIEQACEAFMNVVEVKMLALFIQGQITRE